MIQYTRTDSENIEFRKLVAQLDEELSIRDGAEYGFYAQFNKLDSIRHVIICIDNGTAAGCGALKKFDENRAEIKRMFVPLQHRRKGIASGVLRELEGWAKELGYASCVLETGLNQPEALQLYKSKGYKRIPNYGQYKGVENSVCFEKEI